jgi:hypothetical protein
MPPSKTEALVIGMNEQNDEKLAEQVVWGQKNLDRVNWIWEHIEKIWDGYREARTNQSLEAAQNFAACQNKEIALRYPEYRIGVRRLLMLLEKRFQQGAEHVREHHCGTVRCDDSPAQQNDQTA